MQHVSKKAKLFHFMATQTRSSASQLNVADVRQQFVLFKSDRYISGSGLVICNPLLQSHTSDQKTVNCAGGLRYQNVSSAELASL